MLPDALTALREAARKPDRDAAGSPSFVFALCSLRAVQHPIPAIGPEKQALGPFPSTGQTGPSFAKHCRNGRPRPAALRAALRATPCAAWLFGTAAVRSVLPIVTQKRARKDNIPCAFARLSAARFRRMGRKNSGLAGFPDLDGARPVWQSMRRNGPFSAIRGARQCPLSPGGDSSAKRLRTAKNILPPLQRGKSRSEAEGMGVSWAAGGIALPRSATRYGYGRRVTPT